MKQNVFCNVLKLFLHVIVSLDISCSTHLELPGEGLACFGVLGVLTPDSPSVIPSPRSNKAPLLYNCYFADGLIMVHWHNFRLPEEANL